MNKKNNPIYYSPKPKPIKKGELKIKKKKNEETKIKKPRALRTR